MSTQTDSLETLCGKLNMSCDDEFREAIKDWLDVGADGMGTQKVGLQDVCKQPKENVVLCLSVAVTKEDYCNDY